MRSADEEVLRDLARSVVGRVEGLDLEDVVVVAAGRRSLIRVIVDGDNGVTLDAAAEVSRALGAELDAAEAAGTAFVGAEPYTLEVTSPGIGRPLTEERHFRRARARLLTVTMHDGSKIEGRVRRVADGALELLSGADATVTVVPLAEIRRAKVEVEFGKMPPAHAALLDADGFVDPARAFDEVPGDEFVEDDTDDALDDDDDPDDELDDSDSDSDDTDADDTDTDTDDTDDDDDDDPVLPSDATDRTTPRITRMTEEGQQ